MGNYAGLPVRGVWKFKYSDVLNTLYRGLKLAVLYMYKFKAGHIKLKKLFISRERDPSFGPWFFSQRQGHNLAHDNTL